MYLGLRAVWGGLRRFGVEGWGSGCRVWGVERAWGCGVVGGEWGFRALGGLGYSNRV